MLQPDKIAVDGNEHSQQVALFCWAALPEQQKRFPVLRWMFAIPNGGLRNAVTAARLKAEGVKAGVLDIFLPVPRGEYAGLFIEMKVGDNKPSEQQVKFMQFVGAHSYAACVCYSWEEARDILIWYLNQNSVDLLSELY